MERYKLSKLSFFSHEDLTLYSQTCPGAPPTLHVFIVCLIKHAWFNSSAL